MVISRFITLELGKKDQASLNSVFSTSVIIQLIIALVIVILVESVGVWFLSNKMVIPADRLYAAKWVLQFSLITLIINLISVPYNAVIIAHERMSAFAYISIIDAVGKLAIAFVISISPIDKLIFYSILMCIVAILVRFTYSIYCRKNFEEGKFRLIFDRVLLKEMFRFAGWNYVGSIALILRDQGGDILLNLLGGPVINAARGISVQVNRAVTQFSSNLITAVNPQIIKSYATGNYSYMMTLIFQSSRLSFYLIFLLSLPILLNTNYVLSLWLKIVPDHTVLFVQLSLVFGMIDAISNPLTTAMLIPKNIRNLQLAIGCILIMNLPISYVLLRLGFIPEIILVVAIFISLCALFARLYMLRGPIGLSVSQFLSKVVLNILKVVVVAIIFPLLVVIQLDTSFMSFIIVSFISLTSTIISLYFLGCSNEERKIVNKQFSKIISAIKGSSK